jgi:hypothetical protein
MRRVDSIRASCVRTLSWASARLVPREGSAHSCPFAALVYRLRKATALVREAPAVQQRRGETEAAPLLPRAS